MFSLGVFYQSAQSVCTLCFRQIQAEPIQGTFVIVKLTCSSRVLTVDATVSANTEELEDSWDRTLGKSLLALAAELSGSQSWRARG